MDTAEAEPTAAELAARGALYKTLAALQKLTAAELAARGALYEDLAVVLQQLTPNSTLRDAAPPPVEDQGAETDPAAPPATAPTPAAPLAPPPSPPAPAPAPPPAVEPAAVAPAPAPTAPLDPPAAPAAPAPPALTPPPAVEPAAEQVAAAGGEPDPSHSTKPISAEEAYYCRGMIGQLDEATRKAFKTAFCKAFSISPPPLRVAGLITERRHLEFVIRFVNEAEGVAKP